RIGTAPGVDLAVSGFTSYPLVEGGIVRIPPGCAATPRGATTELRLGAVTIACTRMTLDVSPIARPRPDRRVPVYVAASLSVHLALWLRALVVAPSERRTAAPRRRRRCAHVVSVPPEPAPEPPSSATQVGRPTASPDDSRPAQRERR